MFYVGYVSQFSPLRINPILTIIPLLSGVKDLETGHERIVNGFDLDFESENADIEEAFIALKTEGLFSVEVWDLHDD